MEGNTPDEMMAHCWAVSEAIFRSVPHALSQTAADAACFFRHAAMRGTAPEAQQAALPAGECERKRSSHRAYTHKSADEAWDARQPVTRGTVSFALMQASFP